MAQITNKEEIEFMRNNPATDANAGFSGQIVDPLELSELRQEDISKSDWLYDPMMGARAVLDGYFFGFSDEIAASIAAGSYKMLGLEPDAGAALSEKFRDKEGAPAELEEQSYLDVRREMMTGLEADRDEWTKDNFGKTLGLGLVGALGSGKFVYDAAKTGVNLVSQGASRVLATAPSAQRAVAARQQAGVSKQLGAMEAASPSVSRAAGALPGSVAPVSVLESSVAAIPRTFGQRAVDVAKQEGAALATLGGVAGYGYAGQDDDALLAVGTGAATGFGIGVPMTVLGNSLLNAISKDRLAQQLGKARDFIPLGYATLRDSYSKWERGLNMLYNQAVNKTFASNTLLAQQHKRFSTLADDELVKQENIVAKTAEDVGTALVKAKNVLNDKFDDLRLDKKQAEELTAAEKGELLKQTKEQLKLKAVADADAAQNVAEAAFRVEGLKSAIPQGSPKGTAERLAAIPDMHLRLKELNSLWGEHGYNMLKGRKFRINPANMSVQIQAKLGKVPELLNSLLGSGKATNAAQLVDDFLAAHVGKGGWIDGNDLNNLRTSIAQTANDLGAEGSSASTKALLREIVSTLDDATLRQLPDKSKAAFKKTQEQWTSNLVFRDAVQSSVKKSGQFTLDDWLAAGSKVNRFRAGEGRIPLQGDANTLKISAAQRDAAIKRLADDTIKKQQVEGAKSATASKQQIEKENAVLSRKLRDAKAKKDVEGAKRLEKELKESTARLDTVKGVVSAWGKAEAGANTPIWQQQLSTMLLGAGSRVLGLATVGGLTREGTQRALVGQAQWQKSLQNSLNTTDSFLPRITAQSVRAGEQLDAAPVDTTESETALLNQTEGRKVQAYLNLRRAGKLEELKTKNPKVYEELTSTYARTQSK